MEKSGKQGSRKRKAPMPEEDDKQNELILEEVLSISGKNADVSVEKDESSPDEPKVSENKTKEKVVTQPKKGKAKKLTVSSSASSPSKQKKTDKKKANTVKEGKTSAPEKGNPAPNLPDGWRKEITVRKSGKTIGQTDIYFYSPEGKKLRSRPEVISYIKQNKLQVKIEEFDFSKKITKNAKAVDEKKNKKEMPQRKEVKNQLDADNSESEESTKPKCSTLRKNNKIQKNEVINEVESKNLGSNSVPRKRTKIQKEENEIENSTKATPAKKSRAAKLTNVPPADAEEENDDDEDDDGKKKKNTTVIIKILPSKPKRVRK